jgi:hypothetical protein
VSRRNSLLRRYAGGDGSYPEEVLETAARETCRFRRVNDCVTFFARWKYEHPNSTRLPTALAEVRKSLGAKSASLAPNKIRAVRVLFDGKLADSGFSAKSAREMTNRFTKYYNHVIPFDESVLEAIWNRCDGPRCAAARREVEGMLGLQEGGFSDFPAMKRGGATRHQTSPLESSSTKRGLSPEPAFD